MRSGKRLASERAGKGAEGMSEQELEKWEQYWREAAQRDFERDIYRRCDEEDAARRSGDGH